MKKIITAVLCVGLSLPAFADEILRDGNIWLGSTYHAQVKFTSPQKADLINHSTVHTPSHKATIACDIDQPESCTLKATFHFGVVHVTIFDGARKVGSGFGEIIGVGSMNRPTSNNRCVEGMPCSTTMQIQGTEKWIPITITNRNNNTVQESVQFTPNQVTVTLNEKGKVISSTGFDSLGGKVTMNDNSTSSTDFALHSPEEWVKIPNPTAIDHYDR